MKFRSKLTSLVIAFILAFSLTPAAYAANAATTPSDMATTDLLVQAVSERLNVPCDMMTMIELDIIPEDSYLWTSESIYACDVWNILLPLYGVYPYPTFYYPGIVPREDHLSSSAALEANIAAILTGLAEPTDRLNIEPMSKADLQELIARLATRNYKPLEPPTELPESIADTEWNYRTYGLRNLTLIARDQLPEAWYADFIARDWQLATEIPAETLAKFDVPGLTAGAVTVFADKTIYFQPSSHTSNTVAHEFTHFVAWRAGVTNDQLTECYEEARAAGLHMRGYGWTQPSEFIAVFMERWITNPKDREQLTAQVPKTAALAKQLTEDYARLVQK